MVEIFSIIHYDAHIAGYNVCKINLSVHSFSRTSKYRISPKHGRQSLVSLKQQ